MSRSKNNRNMTNKLASVWLNEIQNYHTEYNSNGADIMVINFKRYMYDGKNQALNNYMVKYKRIYPKTSKMTNRKPPRLEKLITKGHILRKL